MSSGRFQPGQSGNPGGRPKLVGEIRDLARQHTPAAIKTLVDICENGTSEAARVAASQALLDRGWGRAPQTIDVDIGGHVTVEAMTAEQRRAEIVRLQVDMLRLGGQRSAA